MLSKQLISLTLTFTLINSPIVSYAQTKSDLKQVKEPTGLQSIHLQRAIAKEIRDAVGTVKYHDEVKVSPPQLNEFNKAIKEVADAYELRKKELDVGQAVLKGNIALLKGATALGISGAAASGGFSLLISGVGVLGTVGLEKVQELGKEAARDEYRKLLRTRLEEVKKQSESEHARLVDIKDPQKFREELERKTSPLLGDELKKISPDDQDIVNNFHNKILTEVVRDGLKSLSNKQESQQEQISKNKDDIAQTQKNVVGLARTFAEYARDTKDQLDGMQNTQSEIKKGLEELSNKTDQTQKDIGFLQQFMFGKMTPEEQINALKQGIFPKMPSAEREELYKKIHLEEKRQDFNQKVTKYLNGAQELLNIADKCGVKGQFITDAQKVVDIGTNAFNAFTALSSGNYLAGAGALANIFGAGGNRDIAGERHEELKKMLGDVYDKVNLIDKKIDELYKGQEEIKRGQVAILQSILELGEQIAKNHAEIMDKLQEIHGDLFYSRSLQLNYIKEQYERCRDLVEDSNKNRIIDTAKGLYPTNKEFLKLYRDVSQRTFRRCFDRLQDITTGEYEFNKAAFHLESYKDLEGNRDVPNIIKQVYKPLLEIIHTPSTSMPTIDIRYSSLLAPMVRVQDVDDKLKVTGSAYNTLGMQAFHVQMESLLSPTPIQYHTNFLLNIHYYHQIMDPEDRPLNFSELKSLKTIRETGLRDLLKAQRLVDVAIAQQVLISGDITLPIIEKIINKKEPSDVDKALRIKALAAIKSNSVLARNFVMYCIRKQVAAKSKFNVYSIALGGESNLGYLLDAMAPLLPDPASHLWEFTWKDTEVKQGNIVTQEKGWSVKLGDAIIALPSSEDLLEGRLIYPSDLDMLLGLRSRILEEITSYRIYDRIQDKESRRRFNTVLLNSL